MAVKVGTRSVLFGGHAFWLHPWIVAAAWTRLYGFPWDPRLWLAFFVHDLGYIGKPNMDGEAGEAHPELGAKVLRFFGGWPWYYFVLFHSRFYVKKYREGWGGFYVYADIRGKTLSEPQPSRLCYADKVALTMTPSWLHILLCRLSGELDEYMDPEMHQDGGKYEGERHQIYRKPTVWYDSVKEFIRGWVADRADRCPACGHGEWRQAFGVQDGRRFYVCAGCGSHFEHNREEAAA